LWDAAPLQKKEIIMSRTMLQRILISCALGLLIAIGVNEFSFFFLKSDTGRAPQRVELVIPAGTADKIAHGEPEPALPDNMVFVQGDILVVKNEDNTNHRLGPLFIPAGTSASLALDQANNLSYTCSFQPTQTFGLDVREAVTPTVRMIGILISGLPLGFLIMLYSFIIWPLKR
jgi:hypothetical protein